MRSCSLYKVLLMLVCCFPIFQGKLKIQSSKFECGQIATIVCSRTSDTVTGISWFRNDVRTRLCILTECQFSNEGNYNLSTDGAIWTLTIDPVELKDNNITFACQTPNPGNEAPVRVSSTIDVSVVIDDTSTLTAYKSAIDVKPIAMSNCVHPVGAVKITWQCVHAYNVHINDDDCQLDILTTYTSECNDINRPCAGHGTSVNGSVAVLSVYRGELFKWVKVKAIFTDRTNFIENISGRLRQKAFPIITTISPIEYYTRLPRDVTVFVDFYSNREEHIRRAA